MEWGKRQILSYKVHPEVFVFSNPQLVKAMAPTGKAASLLQNATTTIHSSLGLPVPLTESRFKALEGDQLSRL